MSEIRMPLSRQVAARADQLDEVMRRLAIDPVAAVRLDNGGAIAKARLNCLRCKVAANCKKRLERPEWYAEPPEFCANANFFRACIESSN